MKTRRTRSRWRRFMIRSQSRHSARAVRTKRSANAFALGARIGVLMISMLSLAKTASKSRVNLLSRSRIRKRNEPGLSRSVQANWRACLSDPGSGRVGGAAGEVDAPIAELDEEEHVDALQRDRFDGEEVDREHALCLCPQEGTPGEPRTGAGRTQPCLEQQLLHRRRRDGETEAVQLADDPLVAPARILARQAKNQLTDLPADWGPADSTRVRPAARDET